MQKDVERNLGEQPLAGLLREHGLNAHSLVEASTEQITHKMVARACKGRRLTPRVQRKILNAFNRAADQSCSQSDLFTY